MGIDAEIFFKPKGIITPQELVDLNWRFCDATGIKSYHEDGMCLEAVKPNSDGYTHDYGTGASHQVCCLGCYYGPRYEHGNLPTIVAIFQWLRGNFGDSPVWYGGDSSDSLALVTDELIGDLWSHWAQVGREPYVRGFDQGGQAPKCHGRPIYTNVWAGNRRGGYCPVCQKQYWITKDGTGLVESRGFGKPIPEDPS